MKTKIAAVVLMVLLILSLTACQGNTAKSDTSPSDTTAAQSTADATDESATKPETTDGKTLVVYFSATGTTRNVAEHIAEMTEADIYEIKAAQEYTDADLDWNDNNSRSTKEQNDASARPAIAGEMPSLEGYTTIFIGYPIWWGEEPRIMDTFVESCDFEGITMIPFCTSGSSGIGRSGKNLEENAGSGNWLEGQRFGANVSDTELTAWIDSVQ